MHSNQPIPDAVQITMKAFETLIQLDERRRRELVVEISDFSLEYRLSEMPEGTRRMVARLLEPRVAEIQLLDRRIMLVRDKLHDLQQRWVGEMVETSSPAPALSTTGTFSVQA
jgi:hypothetical protein